MLSAPELKTGLETVLIRCLQTDRDAYDLPVLCAGDEALYAKLTEQTSGHGRDRFPLTRWTAYGVAAAL